MAYSPLLAVITGVLELGAALYTLLIVRAGRKHTLVPIGLIFLFLAGYQFAEVMVCTHLDRKIWTQLAYFDITWLPPLGLWLAARLGAARHRWLRTAAAFDFVLAAGFSAWILANPAAITKSVCELVIARYFPIARFDLAYALYYQGSLLATVIGAALGMAYTEDMVRRKHLASLQLGLLGFILPALAVRLLSEPGAGDMMPSVMCHFAFVLAASLFAVVLREERMASAAAAKAIA
jgi:hypothetical protein